MSCFIVSLGKNIDATISIKQITFKTIIMNTDNLNEERNEQQPLPEQENTNLPDEQSMKNSKPKKEKNKKKTPSALTAAAVSRSAVGHTKSHIITNKPGDFAHSGTNISYEN